MFGVLLLATALATSSANEADARQIEAALVAPCCWRQQVSVHTSPAADRMRRDIRARLASGQRPADILLAYEAQYGAAILAEPPARGSNLLLYLLPPLAFAGSAGLLVFTVRRLVRSTPARAPARADGPAGDAAAEDALDDELARME